MRPLFATELPRENQGMDRKAALFEKITAAISGHFDIPREQIRAETRLADLDLDSVALVELALVLEDELGIAADLDVTMEDNVGGIAARLSAAHAARS